jgi:hypothetical protein
MRKLELALVSEFDEWSQAESAGRALQAEGFDMGELKIVGANWLCEIDPGGRRTLRQGAILGMQIAVPIFSILGLIVGFVNAANDPASNRISTLALPTLAMLAFGAVLGALAGSLFCRLEHSVDPPEWAEALYGNHLRNGSCLLLLQGELTKLMEAVRTVKNLNPNSIRIMPSKD